MKIALILSPEIKESRDPDIQWKIELLTCFLLFWTHWLLSARNHCMMSNIPELRFNSHYVMVCSDAF